LRTGPSTSAGLSHVRLCVARRRSAFQNRSITSSGGLYDGSRFNAG
jgi:hypothetical protein